MSKDTNIYNQIVDVLNLIPSERSYAFATGYFASRIETWARMGELDIHLVEELIKELKEDLTNYERRTMDSIKIGAQKAEKGLQSETKTNKETSTTNV